MNKQKTALKSEPQPTKRLSKKELAKQYRHEAYLRAKEYRKTDSDHIAMKEKLKEQDKERRKAYQDENKKALKGKTVAPKTDKQKKMKAKAVSANTMQ